MFGSLTNFESLVEEFQWMQETMDELFDGWAGPTGIRSVWRGRFPATNVGATPNTVEAYLFAPGLDPKSLDLTIQQNLL
ncbi:MAG TPA: Hsp20/alpha crystallin family protein, partial [Burkholderiaceae bacterium]|nr:Hsp20/alpha crystallin family protein [Burkholderiaceae bacterium]